MILGRFKVSGHSMIPALKPGQQVLVSSIPYFFWDPKIGDLVAFKVDQKFIVKRIKELGENRYRVSGDNKTDSREYGWIKRQEIIGKVIYP